MKRWGGCLLGGLSPRPFNAGGTVPRVDCPPALF